MINGGAIFKTFTCNTYRSKHQQSLVKTFFIYFQCHLGIGYFCPFFNNLDTCNKAFSLDTTKNIRIFVSDPV